MSLFLCPVGCLSLAETAHRAETEQRQDATKKIEGWHHQIWIPNYLGFIVLILIAILQELIFNKNLAFEFHTWKLHGHTT